ncbi:DHHA1 domain-containing protein [Infirmifilum lucidum]|nr:DHHA1 domain-containing protein [Infirmifilum lucidum]
MVRITLIAHGDIDGLASAAIVIAHYLYKEKQLKYQLYFAQPFSLHVTLNRAEVSASNVLYILDVALYREHWEQVSQRVLGLRGKLEVNWVDHHPSTISNKDVLEAVGIRVMASPAPATASLLRGIALETGNPGFYERLIALAEVADATEEPQDSGLASAVEILSGSLALDPLDDEFKRRLVEYWVKRQLLVPEEAAERFEVAEEKARKLYEEARSKIVYESLTLRVIDLRETRVYGFTGRIASHQAKVDGKVVLVLFRVGYDSVVITGRAPDNLEVNLDEIFREVARLWGGSGGGHHRAASLRVPAPVADKVLDEVVKEVEASLSRRVL